MHELAPAESVDDEVRPTKSKPETVSNEEEEDLGKLSIDQQTLARIAPKHPRWTDEKVFAEFQRALEKISNAEIIHDPFDHFSVPNLFSNDFYIDLMNELPPPEVYKPQGYAGTAPTFPVIKLGKDNVTVPGQCASINDTDHTSCWHERVELHQRNHTAGRILTVNTDATNYPLWVQAFRFVHSRNFTNLLYSKFATNTGIPEWKQKSVAEKGTKDGVPTLRNTVALRIEPTQYHLTPHVDMYQKLVTWQFFHPESFELEDRNVGTMFYKLKPEVEHIQINDRANPSWLDYSHFDVVKEHPVIPNYFFAFSPNNHSFHGAAIDDPKMEGVNRFARRTFLGFVTTEMWKYHHFNKDDWAPKIYDFVL